MLLGYARVSTTDQHLDLQKDELKQAGCRRIFHDVASGSCAERPSLNHAIAYAREGDSVVVWKLDRFGRSLARLIEGVRQLQVRGIGFRSLHENIDTTSSAGKLIFHLFGALADYAEPGVMQSAAPGSWLTAA